MKYLITVFLSISILLSCQKTQDFKKQENTKDENSAQYLKIPIDNNIVFIGPLNSINNDVQGDYTVKAKNDTIFVYKNFLESNDIDGAEIKFENSNADKQIKISYQIAYLFNGTEKANQFIDINHFFSTIIEPKNKIPAFTEIRKNNDLTKFLILNKEKIQATVYNDFINYYKNIPEEELKICCPTDYLNYNKLKNISKEDIQRLDVENDLGAYLDYQTLIIEIASSSKEKSIIVFSRKDEQHDSY